MSILRLSTLSLSLAIAVFALGYVNSSSAAPKNCDTHPRPACNPDPDPDPDPPSTITYTAELRGAFVFGTTDPWSEEHDPLSVDSHGNYLQHNAPVTITRPDCEGSDCDAWETYDHVFSMPAADSGEECNLFGPPPFGPEWFTAPKNENNVKGWEIDEPGGVRVLFRGVSLAETDLELYVGFTLQLIGDCDYSGGTESCDPFLPEPGEDGEEGISEITLSHFRIQAKAAKGTRRIDGCHSAGGDLPSVSTLVIRATKN